VAPLAGKQRPLLERGAVDQAELGEEVASVQCDRPLKTIGLVGRGAGVVGLAQVCRNCSLLAACRGGPRAHRFSRERGFDNPGVYCADWQTLIRHLQGHRAHTAAAALSLV
jgi:uncharacterized protein